jgi:hypothetical protein
MVVRLRAVSRVGDGVGVGEDATASGSVTVCVLLFCAFPNASGRGSLGYSAVLVSSATTATTSGRALLCLLLLCQDVRGGRLWEV